MCLRGGNVCVRSGALVGRYEARAWQPHVLSHLPMYGVLVPLAAEAAQARARHRPHEAAASILRVRVHFQGSQAFWIAALRSCAGRVLNHSL